MTDPALQALLDKQAIAELLTRYLRSVDRGDVATLRAGAQVQARAHAQAHADAQAVQA